MSDLNAPAFPAPTGAGLTKREYAAIQIFSQMFSYPTPGRKPLSQIADQAIAAADALLSKL